MNQGQRDGLLYLAVLSLIAALTWGLVWADRACRNEKHECIVAWLGRDASLQQAIDMCK